MQGDKIGDEDVTSPSRHHVAVEERCESSPHDRSVLDSLNPKEECENKQENSNGLIVVTPSHRSGDVARRYSHEACRQKTRRWRGRHFGREEIHRKSCQPRTSRGEEDADVSNVDRYRE